MALQHRVATSAIQIGGVLAILGLAVTVFLLLPADLAFNDYVAGTIFGATIILLSVFAQVTRPEAEQATPTGSDR